MSDAIKPRSLNYVKLFFLFLAVIFVVRLIYLQVLVSHQYSAEAEEIRTINYTTEPHRGTIYDRNGVVLAVSVDAMTIYANPSEVEDVDYTARKLAEVLGGDAEDYRKKLRDDQTTFAYMKRKADVSDADKIKNFNLKGIYFLEESRREYPNGSTAGQVIGTCDVDGNGICGLELYYNDILAGTPGVYSGERGETGTPIPGGVHEKTPAVDGQDIMISLDITLQHSVEKALKDGLDKRGYTKGSSVVLDAETGEIYAICSYPYLNPADLSNSVVGSDNLTPITTAFEPGSVFKAFSALAILQERAMKPSDVILVPSYIEADGYIVKDAHDHPNQNMSFQDILDQSSNIGVSLSVEKIGFDKLHQILTRLKFAQETGVDYPGESAGLLTDYDTWSKVGSYNISFGQGVMATPLQITSAYGAIANDGVMNAPHFLISLPQTGEWTEKKSEEVLTDKEALSTLRTMLRGVVTNGTGTDAGVDGYEVVGKTSTAQIAENGGYAANKYNLCFAGFIDNSSSKLVAMVTANDVLYEGTVTSIFHDIMVSAIDLYKIVPN